MTSFVNGAFRPLQMGSLQDILTKAEKFIPGLTSTSQPVAQPIVPVVVPQPTIFGLPQSVVIWGGAALLGAGLIYAVVSQNG